MLVVVAALAGLLSAVPAQAGVGATTVLVSVAYGGGAANDGSRFDAITPDGRFVLFDSLASNLVPGDSNRRQDVFVRNLATGRTVRVSVGPHGRQADAYSYGDAITPDGRFIVFTSSADNLLRQPDTNRVSDVFVRDRRTGRTIRVSVGRDGRQLAGTSMGGVITADGNQIAFMHVANHRVLTLIHNRSTDTTRVIDRHKNSQPYAISDTGRYLLLGRDFQQNGPIHLVMRDRQTTREVQIPIPPPDRVASDPAMTPDARYVAFTGGYGYPNPTAFDAFLWQRGAAQVTTIRNEPQGIDVAGISSDGRYIGLLDPTPLIIGDTNATTDLYRFDMNGGPIIRASVTDTGAQLPSGATDITICCTLSFGAVSGDGAVVAFNTYDPAVASDTNNSSDVYARTGL
jgi:Tol biopolymer transport system component